MNRPFDWNNDVVAIIPPPRQAVTITAPAMRTTHGSDLPIRITKKEYDA